MSGIFTASALLPTMGMFFCGVVAALAIHCSFRLSAREKRYELRIREHEKLVDTVSEFVGKSIATNTMPRLSETPDSAATFEQNKQALRDLYSFVENNYANVLISGVLFEKPNKADKRLQKLEAQVASSRKQFAEHYRRLYHALHDYIGASLSGMNSLFITNNATGQLSQIWEGDIELYATDWDHCNGQNYGEELVSACQQQDELLANITQSAVETRDALAVFTECYKAYEQASLLYPQPCKDVDGNPVGRLQEYKDFCAKNPI